jgi:hypothetical protein
MQAIGAGPVAFVERDRVAGLLQAVCQAHPAGAAADDEDMHQSSSPHERRGYAIISS